MNESPSKNLSFRDAFREAGFCGRSALIFSSWFCTGLVPWAPGTFGSLATLPLIAVLTYLGTVFHGIAIIIFFPLAVWASQFSSILLKNKDPPGVVIDEVIRLMLTFFLLPLSWISLFSGFMFFRVFDIHRSVTIKFHSMYQ